MKIRLQTLSKECEEKLKHLYPFQPTFSSNKNFKQHNKVHSSIISDPFDKRLLKYDQQRNVKLEILKKGLEDQYVKDNQLNLISKKQANKSFITTKNNRSVSADPVSYIAEKYKKIRELEKSINEERGITFKPRINTNIPVQSNIIARNFEHQKKVDEKIKILSAFDDYECTFTPNINKDNNRSNSLDQKNNSRVNNSSNLPYRGEEAGFRLYEYRKFYDQKKLYMSESLVENYPFKPIISKNTDVILENKRKYLENLKNNFPPSLEKDDNYDVENNNDAPFSENNKLMNPDFYLSNLNEDVIEQKPIMHRDNSKKLIRNKYSQQFNNNTIEEEAKEAMLEEEGLVSSNMKKKDNKNNFNAFNPSSSSQTNLQNKNTSVNPLKLNNLQSQPNNDEIILYSNRLTFNDNLSPSKINSNNKDNQTKVKIQNKIESNVKQSTPKTPSKIKTGSLDTVNKSNSLKESKDAFVKKNISQGEIPKSLQSKVNK